MTGYGRGAERAAAPRGSFSRGRVRERENAAAALRGFATFGLRMRNGSVECAPHRPAAEFCPIRDVDPVTFPNVGL